MFIVQINDNSGVLKELVWIGVDYHKGWMAFIETCAEVVSNWDEMTVGDTAAFLDEGYCQFGGGCVILIDTSNCATDDELRDQLSKQPSGDVTIATIIQDGEVELTVGMTVDEILEACCGNLDTAHSWDIQGQILFKGSDGKWYTITTESIIGEANPQFVTDMLAENKDA